MRNGFANFGYALVSVSLFFILLVPMLTMRIMAEENRQKTDQLLFTSPVSVTKIIVGKYLSMLTMFGIVMLIICLYPSILHGADRNIPHDNIAQPRKQKQKNCKKAPCRPAVLRKRGSLQQLCLWGIRCCFHRVLSELLHFICMSSVISNRISSLVASILTATTSATAITESTVA